MPGYCWFIKYDWRVYSVFDQTGARAKEPEILQLYYVVKLKRNENNKVLSCQIWISVYHSLGITSLNFVRTFHTNYTITYQSIIKNIQIKNKNSQKDSSLWLDNKIRVLHIIQCYVWKSAILLIQIVFWHISCKILHIWKYFI